MNLLTSLWRRLFVCGRCRGTMAVPADPGDVRAYAMPSGNWCRPCPRCIKAGRLRELDGGC